MVVLNDLCLGVNIFVLFASMYVFIFLVTLK